jgi:hypothetical protein
MITSMHAEKALDKIPNPFMVINTLKKPGRNASQHTTYDKPTANIILNEEKMKSFPLKSGTR